MRDKLNKFLKFAKYLYLLTVVILLMTFGYFIYETRSLSKKFDATNVNISRQKLFEIWGEPDEEFDMNQKHDRRHIIMYKDLFGKYVFTSATKGDYITEKFYDD